MPPSDSYKNRWLSNRRTPANGADPRHVVILQRSRSPLLYSWHLNWDEVAPGSFTRASAAMRQEVASRPATEAFVGGIDASGAKIYSAPISVNGPGTWALVDSYSGALDVALAFGGGMVPLPRYTTVAGVPLTELMAADKIEALVERTRKGGIEIVNLLGTSAYYAPAAGAVKMAEAILKNTGQVMCCCAWCDGVYGIRGEYVGVPVRLGCNGVEQVVALELNAQEQAMFDTSASHVRELVEKVDAML